MLKKTCVPKLVFLWKTKSFTFGVFKSEMNHGRKESFSGLLS